MLIFNHLRQPEFVVVEYRTCYKFVVTADGSHVNIFNSFQFFSISFKSRLLA